MCYGTLPLGVYTGKYFTWLHEFVLCSPCSTQAPRAIAPYICRSVHHLPPSLPPPSLQIITTEGRYQLSARSAEDKGVWLNKLSKILNNMPLDNRTRK